MVSNIFVGIDPGVTGSIALLRPEGFLYCSRFDHDDPLDVISCVLQPIGESVVVGLEAVHAFPGQGLSSTFNFGRGYGEIIGWLKAFKIKYELVSPMSWQKILPHSDEGPKMAVRRFCTDTWPEGMFIYKGCRTPHQGSMDAACIAHYLKEVQAGRIKPPEARAKAKKSQPIRLV